MWSVCPSAPGELMPVAVAAETAAAAASVVKGGRRGRGAAVTVAAAGHAVGHGEGGVRRPAAPVPTTPATAAGAVPPPSSGTAAAETTTAAETAAAAPETAASARVSALLQLASALAFAVGRSDAQEDLGSTVDQLVAPLEKVALILLAEVSVVAAPIAESRRSTRSMDTGVQETTG